MSEMRDAWLRAGSTAARNYSTEKGFFPGFSG
jgi:hypothetical protein